MVQPCPNNDCERRLTTLEQEQIHNKETLNRIELTTKNIDKSLRNGLMTQVTRQGTHMKYLWIIALVILGWLVAGKIQAESPDFYPFVSRSYSASKTDFGSGGKVAVTATTSTTRTVTSARTVSLYNDSAVDVQALVNTVATNFVGAYGSNTTVFIPAGATYTFTNPNGFITSLVMQASSSTGIVYVAEY